MIQRSDIVLARFPFTDLIGTKKSVDQATGASAADRSVTLSAYPKSLFAPAGP